MFVRWLGAFRNGSDSLNQSLSFELGRDKKEEVACEPLDNKISSIKHARVGLVVARQAIISSFKGDVWSEQDENGRLHTTRKPVNTHKEAFAHPVYTAICIDMTCGRSNDYHKKPYAPSARVLKTVKWISDMYNIPVLYIKNGKSWRVSL